MGKINVLSFEIANLIAAGEVVERPSSVLKELLENSIDAGATRVVAEIKRGGVAMIRVTDNGCGMTAEDLPVALKRHATSKIREKEDLASIMTLGFRGEALAAISSVSKVTVITKTEEAEEGTMLVSEGGRVLDISAVGASTGTTVVVEDLFYNVPARRKFLKKDATEAMNVAALLERVALSRPDISIQLLVDGEERFKTPGDGSLKNAISAVHGREFAKKLLSVDAKAEGVEVTGFIGRSDNVRKNRNMQNVFINGRYVKSLTVMAALEKAYTSYIAPECFPICVLFLTMNPAFVDVNVHPAKLEVKFSDERTVFEAVYHAVRRTLEEAAWRPEMTIGNKAPERPLSAAFVPLGEKTAGEQIKMPPLVREKRIEPAPVAQKPSYAEPRPSQGASLHREPSFSTGPRESADAVLSPKASIDILEKYKASAPVNQVASFTSDMTKQTEGAPFIPPVSTAPAAAAAEPLPVEETAYKFVGEAFDCYLMVELADTLLIIDKHAAHERIIFEDLKASREKDGRVASQALLLPIALALDAESLSAAQEYREDFLCVGFDFSVVGRGVEISAIPDAISTSDAEALFAKMADELVKGRGNPSLTEALRREKALYQVACKAAIKGGRRYNREIAEHLIGRVLALPDITVCPHGRPIAYRLTKRELDKNFDRIK
ncbi:MAG: DNA mismatch repair endonuclease MutL [Clostridia bacterium]|nr:DNA mismatch repair endonuclease MutL [Clostridia bacterium]